jgi:hypothetical protein
VTIKHFTTQLKAVDNAIAETIDQAPDPQAKDRRINKRFICLE